MASQEQSEWLQRIRAREATALERSASLRSPATAAASEVHPRPQSMGPVAVPRVQRSSLHRPLPYLNRTNIMSSPPATGGSASTGYRLLPEHDEGDSINDKSSSSTAVEAESATAAAQAGSSTSTGSAAKQADSAPVLIAKDLIKDMIAHAINERHAEDAVLAERRRIKIAYTEWLRDTLVNNDAQLADFEVVVKFVEAVADAERLSKKSKGLADIGKEFIQKQFLKIADYVDIKTGKTFGATFNMTKAKAANMFEFTGEQQFVTEKVMAEAIRLIAAGKKFPFDVANPPFDVDDPEDLGGDYNGEWVKTGYQPDEDEAEV